MKLKSVKSKIVPCLEEVCSYSWWMILFLILCYMFYEQEQQKQKEFFEGLHTQLEELKLEKKKAVDLQKRLLMQINSQSDPAWVELALIKGLGVVPEGQRKVFFTDQNNKSENYDGVPESYSPYSTH